MAAQLNLNTEKMEKIKARVEDVNEELAAQATTISEIAALLEGKSVPGGAVEMCTVTVAEGHYGGYTVYLNANLELVDTYMDLNGSTTTFNVAKNSLFVSGALWGTNTGVTGMAQHTSVDEAFYITGDCTLYGIDD